jgi:osmotically-inducible protein OsmY
MTTRVATLALALWLGSMTAPALAQQREPQMPQQSNEYTEDLILVRLAERAWVGGDFQVKVQQGAATVSGTVPSEAARARMLRVVRRTPGITEVHDRIQVRPASAIGGAPAATDAQLAQRVAQQLAGTLSGAKAGEDWWGTGWRVEGPSNAWSFIVQVEQGDVTIDGEVPRFSVIRQVVEKAADVQGVQSVRSQLEVERPHYPYAPYGYFPYGYPYYAYPYRGVYPYHGPSAHGWDPYGRDGRATDQAASPGSGESDRTGPQPQGKPQR